MIVTPDGAVYTLGYDGLVRHYNDLGNLVWSKVLLPAAYEIRGFQWHAGSLFLAGNKAFGSGGETDGFVGKFTPAGTQVWLRTFGTSQPDAAGAITFDTTGNVFVGGSTAGVFANNTGSGQRDLYLRKMTPNGTALWTRQLGSSADDGLNRVAVGPDGELYLSGTTGGDLGAGNQGGTDAFLMKLANADGSQAWVR